ncbi:MAG: hypothetical protein ACKOE7_13745 [Actinomycetota bacterium]
MSDLRDDVFHERREAHLHISDRCGPGLLSHDLHFGGHVKWIVRAYLAPEAVLQRGDDAPAIGVVLGVCRRHQQHVER